MKSFRVCLSVINSAPKFKMFWNVKYY
jgi:hypothetical protein